MPIRQFDPSRAVEVTAPNYGSGYRIGGRLILTAAHLLNEVGSDCEVRDKLGFGKENAQVAWKAQGLDIALIEIAERIAGVEAITLGKLPEANTGEKLAFQMYAYPLWGQTERVEGRSAAGGRQIEGIIYLSDRSPDGLLVLEPQRLPPEFTTAKSEWAGASGAAIICDGLVIAVQSQHQKPNRPASLEAAPLWKVYEDERLRQLLMKHGINPDPEIAHLPAAENQPTRPRNELILLKVIEQEVDSRLAQSLHNHVFVTLDKESYPEQVRRLWDAEIKIGAKPPQPIPPKTSIIKAFEQTEIAGRLLILGAPGSGKTTTMLDLAKALVAKAKQDLVRPIPVLFNLSSWTDPRQLMPDWLVEELKSKYGMRKDLAEKWLQEQLILPMLDGLDEVKIEHQESCVEAINCWLEGDLRPPSVVVCSRQEEYANYQARLNLNGAILLQSLTDEQIQEYLLGVNRTETWQLLQQNTELLELVRTPLLLSITILSYAKLSLQQWQALNSTQQRVKLLLDAYVQTMFERKLNSRAYRKRRIPLEKQTRQWLRVLSLKMQRESQTEFLIEKMEPYVWLSGKQKGRYRLSVELIFGLIFGLSQGLIGGLFWGLSGGLICGLIGGLCGGLIGRLIGELGEGLSSSSLKLVETFNWSFNDAIFGLKYGLIGGLIGGLFFGLIGGLSGGLSQGLSGGLRGGLSGGLICGLIGGLSGGLSFLEIDVKARPNQGILKSASNALLITVICGLSFGLFGGLFFGLNYVLIFGLTFGQYYGLYLGGGVTCIQHLSLRLILYHNETIPWNYARFLNHCTELLFLQRVGGRYRFIHKLLQDYFAEMELSNKEQHKSTHPFG